MHKNICAKRHIISRRSHEDTYLKPSYWTDYCAAQHCFWRSKDQSSNDWTRLGTSSERTDNDSDCVHNRPFNTTNEHGPDEDAQLCLLQAKSYKKCLGCGCQWWLWLRGLTCLRQHDWLLLLLLLLMYDCTFVCCLLLLLFFNRQCQQSTMVVVVVLRLFDRPFVVCC